MMPIKTFHQLFKEFWFCLIITVCCTIQLPAQRAYILRSSAFLIKGDAAVIGNRVMQGALSTKNDDGTNMTQIDLDGSASTTLNSSSADLVLPVGATVQWAGLYWGARSNSASRNTIKFKKLGDVYATYTATQLDNGNTIADLVGEDHYQGFVNITTYIQANGAGTYWAGDVRCYTGSDTYTGYYAGWSLVIIYSDAAQPYRSITVFDGYNAVYSSNQTVSITGFLTPAVAGFTTKLGVVAWEGDLFTTGDRMRLNANTAANTVFDANNPITNFFNSTISSTPRNPNTVNNWGVDFDYIVSNIALPTNASNTNVYFNTTGDLYIPGVLVFAVDINPVLLPVEMLSFDAKEVNREAHLEWATASEKNNCCFTVQRSLDTKEWDDIGKVPGNGTTSSYNNYEFSDTDAAGFLLKNNADNNLIYYRLMQEDYNGQTTASAVRSVKFNLHDFDFSIYPNPANTNSKITFSGFNMKNTDVRLIADNGKEIFAAKSTSNIFDLKNIKIGSYFIEVKKENMIMRKRLIVE